MWLPILPVSFLYDGFHGGPQAGTCGVILVLLWLMDAALPGSHLGAGAQPTCPAPGQTKGRGMSGRRTHWEASLCDRARGSAWAVTGAWGHSQGGFGGEPDGASPPPSGRFVPEAQPGCSEQGSACCHRLSHGPGQPCLHIHLRTNQGPSLD